MLLGALVRELQLAMLKERENVDGRLAIRTLNALVDSLAKNAAEWKELGVSNPEEAVDSIGLWTNRIVNRDDDLDLPPRTLPKVKLVQPQSSWLVPAPGARAV
jgi:hypothetical protein